MKKAIVAISVVLLMLATVAVVLADNPEDDKGNQRGGPHAEVAQTSPTTSGTPSVTSTAVVGTQTTASTTATATPSSDADTGSGRGRGQNQGRGRDGDVEASTDANDATNADAGHGRGKEGDRAEGSVGQVAAVDSAGFDLLVKDQTAHVLAGVQTDVLLRGRDDGTLADITVDSKVKVWGSYDKNGNLVADRVRVVPSRVVVSGEVVEVSDNSIAVDPDDAGANVTFAIDSDTRIQIAGDGTTIAAREGKKSGDDVTIIGGKDGSAAKLIVVHGGDS